MPSAIEVFQRKFEFFEEIEVFKKLNFSKKWILKKWKINFSKISSKIWIFARMIYLEVRISF